MVQTPPYVPEALNFNQLLSTTKRQQSLTEVPVVFLTSHRLFNLLQSNGWGDKHKRNCYIICDTRSQTLFEFEHIRGAYSLTEFNGYMKDNKESVSSFLNIILYGSNGLEDPIISDLIQQLKMMTNVIESLFILKESFESFQKTSGKLLCCQRHYELWFRFPTEIISQGRLYLAYQDTIEFMSSRLLKLLNVRYIIDVSHHPVIPDTGTPVDSLTPPRYISIKPTLSIHSHSDTDLCNTSIEIVESQLYLAIEAIKERIAINNSTTLVFSRDSSCISAAVIVAYMMVEKGWKTHLALAFLMSKYVDIRWQPSQLQLLYAMEHLTD